MIERRIYIEISGGCYQCSANVPEGWRVELVDWDNLLGDAADTAEEWKRLDAETRAFVRKTYPEDYKSILATFSSPTG